MSYNREDYIRIKAEYSQKYLRAQSLANERRAELYAAIPGVGELDGALSKTGMRIMSVIVEGGSDTNEKIEKIRNEVVQQGFRYIFTNLNESETVEKNRRYRLSLHHKEDEK